MVYAIILTLNEEKHVTACIESLAWADQIIVMDSYSTDATVSLAKQQGAIVHQQIWVDFAHNRNLALELVPANEWVLFVDADERVTPALAQEIQTIVASDSSEVGWWIPRWNYILGHIMQGAGWRPDRQLRLLKQGKAWYNPDKKVHEVVVLDGESGQLEESFIHFNYETLKQFWTKQRRYLDYDVRVLLSQGVKPKWYTPYTQVLRHFYWRFITLHGWKDHVYGVLLSAFMAYYDYLKYHTA